MKTSKFEWMKKFTCYADFNAPVGPMLGGRKDGVNTLSACMKACQENAGCKAFTHNKYNHCYLRRHLGPLSVDDKKHGTVSCSKN